MLDHEQNGPKLDSSPEAYVSLKQASPFTQDADTSRLRATECLGVHDCI